MKRAALPALVAALGLAACEQGGNGYAPGIYELQRIDGQGFAWGATMDLTEQGRISGQAPCNSYSAEQEAPYPQFAPGPIAATERACFHMRGEAQFFRALARMSRAEIMGPVLVLSGEGGGEMVFRRRDP